MNRLGIWFGTQGRRPTAAAWRTCVLAATGVLLAACAGTGPTRQAALDPRNGDGLGGTGIKTADLRPGDGLGGTGIIGTISGFGSIIVNGLELEFDRGTAVGNDGRPASLEELRVGQVVQGVARRKDGRLSLDSLDIQHAVSGPISAIDYTAQTMTVLGQSVRLNLGGDKGAAEAFRTLRIGDVVSVSGLRTADGKIIASRIDQEGEDGRMLVRGDATTVSGDHLRIGALDVPMTADAVVSKPANGGRVFVSGRMINGTFTPDVITGGTGLPFGGKVGDVSLEGYAPAPGKPVTLYGATVDTALPPGTVADDHIVVTGQINVPERISAAAISKIRTVVTIMKAHGGQRPAAMRSDPARPERVVPTRPDIQKPESTRPDVPSRPAIERPGAVTGV